MAKRPAQAVRETAPGYRVASRKSPRVVSPQRQAAAKRASALEAAWSAYTALDRAARDEFFTRVLDDREILEDLLDLAIIESRRGEPTRPLEEYLRERRQRQRHRPGTK